MPRKSTANNTKNSQTSKNTLKKASPNNSVKSTAKVSTPAKKTTTKQPEKEKTTTAKSLRIKRSYIFVVIVFIVLGLLLYYYKGLFVAAVVNGQPISRWSVIHETEKQSGAQALNTLIRNTLIEQEASREHVTVSDSEINTEIKTVESNLTKQGQKLDDVLKQQNMTRDDLRNLIRLDKLVQKMVGKDIKISDKDANDYIAQNKDSLPKGESQAQLMKDVKSRLQQQELSTKVQTWLADLQSKAKIKQFVQYASSPSQPTQ